MESTVNLKVASKTHIGFIRERNEDDLFVSSDKRTFAVADGMGGMAAGDRASRLAVQAVSQMWTQEPCDLSKAGEVREWVAEAISRANGAIMKESFRLGLDMGTTLVLAVQGDNGVLSFGHLGDSRLYSSRHGRLTVDHAIGAHELTNFAGRSLKASPDLSSTVCKSGDRILLCTDGLNKVVEDDEIMEAMAKASDPESMLESLLEQALDFGGPDNITMIAYEYL